MKDGELNGPPGNGSPPQRRPGFSVFRPGQTLHRPPVALEQKGPRERLPAPMLPSFNPMRVWESLSLVVPDPDFMAGNGLFLDANQSPVTAQFDILRTRILQVMEERGWKRIAVTSPSHGCGKSFVAANLALSLARIPSCRIVLMDLELRHPDLARLLGITAPPIRDFLLGEQPLESHFRRMGRNLALGLNGVAVAGAAELLHLPTTAEALAAMIDHLAPSMVVYDLPPTLGSDDVIAAMPQIDAVLLVADGTQTTADEMRACERLFEGHVPLMGVVLNRSEDRKPGRYSYGKR